MSSNIMLLMGNERRDHFLNQTALLRLLSWCQAWLKFKNSKCCNFKIKNVTGSKTSKNMYFWVIFYLVWMKNSENLVALILELHDIK